MFKKITAIALLTMLSFSSLYADIEVSKELEAAQFLAAQGIINQSNTPAEYRLGDTITRKEMAKLVTKLAGANPVEKCEGKFSDVASDWGCKYIERMLSVGFIASAKTYRPDDNITKSEAVKMIFKARGIEKIYNTGDWQSDYAKTASDLGLVNIYTDYSSDATRGWIFLLAANDFEEFLEFGDEVMTDEGL